MIYIIEDSCLKAENILATLEMGLSVEQETKHFLSYQSGLKGLLDQAPDIVILDMTLPTFDRKPYGREGRVRPLGGYDLLRKIKYKSIRTKVIVLTQLESFGEGQSKISLDEISDTCRSEFPGIFVESIYFEQTSEAWKASLLSAVNSILTIRG